MRAWSPLLAVALLLTPAIDTSAGVLSMRWLSDPDAQSISLWPGESADAGIYVDLLAGESVISLDFSYRQDTPPPADMLDLIAVTGEHSFFFANPSLGSLDDANTGLALLPATPPLPPIDPPRGAGTFLLANTTIQLTGTTDGTPQEIMFERIPTILQEGGGEFTWDQRYGANYSGYMAFGDYGNPGWPIKCDKCGPLYSPSPLEVIEIPEPSAAALLSILAFALVMRRRPGA